MILRRRELRALLEAIDLLYQPVGAGGFPGHLFAAIALVLPETVAAFDMTETATGAVESHVSAHAMLALPPGEIEEIVRLYAWQNPVMKHIATGDRRAVLRPSDLISQREFRRTDLYQLAFRSSGMEYQIAAGIAWPGHHGGLSVLRDKTREFSDREVEIIRRLRPHVERAHGYAKAQAALAGKPSPAPADQGPMPAPLSPLTERESEVLHWVSEGKRNREIAAILGISPRTVTKHMEHIFAKLGVETRVGAATWRLRPGAASSAVAQASCL